MIGEFTDNPPAQETSQKLHGLVVTVPEVGCL